MRRSTAFLLILMLLAAAGCARPSAVEPAVEPPAPVAVPPEVPGKGAQTAPAPAEPSAVTPPALSFDDLLGVRLTNGHPAFSSFLSLEAYGELLHPLLTAYGQVRTAEGVVRSGPTRFTLTLYMVGGEDVTMVVRPDQSVVLKGAGGGTIRSPELTRALEALIARVLPLRADAVPALEPSLGDGWVPQAEKGPWARWANEGQAMQITARYLPGVQLDAAGQWLLPEEYTWSGILNPVRVPVKGAVGVTYTGLRFTPIQGGTGGGFFGTVPVEVAMVGRQGGLSLQCNQTASEQDHAKRQQLQALVDERCPALLARFTVDLGEPVEPALEIRQQAELQKDGTLLLPPGPPTWMGERGLRQWQIRSGGTAWLLDLERGEVRPTPLTWLDSPLRLDDGQVVGLKRDRWPGTKHITIVLQDLSRATETEIGEIFGDITASARAGQSAFAYSLPGPEPYAPGALFQYDWSKKVHLMIAEQGWPVGLLADGRAVAHRGLKQGPLFTWRAEAPDRVTPLTPDGVHPYGGTLSPHGRRLVYFHAETARTDYPRVVKVALFDLASGQTLVRDLPELGHVENLTWDKAGNLLFSHRWPQGMAVLLLTPGGELERLTPPGETGSWVGWDGCALLLAGNEGFVRHAPAGCDLESGPADLGQPDRRVGWRPLIAFPATGGLEILDTRTGKRYHAPGASLPMIPVPPWASLAPLRPESGYVALVVQWYPQPVYRLLPVAAVE